MLSCKAMMKKYQRMFLVKVLIFLLLSVCAFRPAYAASQAECAIWLCLPAGFSVSECGAAHAAFLERLRKGKAPLPPLSSCSVEESGATDGNSRYETGYEVWESCKSGYRALDYIDPLQAQRVRTCVSQSCPNPQPDVVGNLSCDHYAPVKRTQPNFIKLWVNGKYQGQYFY